ncbi:hydrogen peroxide-inducible genes activator [Rhodalgimonas zhirmunskyi]|uniref:LysR substrate-binding domain-containing protein n=1 Tax=Rhodalgimonas zhirmunskyi TaxID=2964767 RepID=A0AAJ1X475_9RHOB|nr:LysR substrate-binding domain-containing protein [Rhodoalgimonas zhirmunskyi]MDQ2092839.1 LysR substrate-binding domain-containing protein [Rhodoalgimonas zhirmunskyi]
MDITLRQMRYFKALSETRHFGQAAEMCHVSQPALSTQIKEMEARLGAVLVDRRGREVALTPAGWEVLRTARAIEGELARMQESLRWRGGLRGKLRLGVIPTVAPYLLPVALPLLRGRDVRLDLRVREAQTDTLLNDLADGRLDAAVIALPSGATGLVEMPLFEDRFLLAGSAMQLAALKARGLKVAPDSIDPERLLLLDEGHCLADQALAVCGLKREAARVDLGASSLATLCGLVGEGFGLTFLPELAIESEAAGLSLMRFPAPEPFRTVGLVCRDLGAPAGWFEELSAMLSEAGEAVIARAMVRWPRAG